MTNKYLPNGNPFEVFSHSTLNVFSYDNKERVTSIHSYIVSDDKRSLIGFTLFSR